MFDVGEFWGKCTQPNLAFNTSLYLILCFIFALLQCLTDYLHWEIHHWAIPKWKKITSKDTGINSPKSILQIGRFLTKVCQATSTLRMFGGPERCCLWTNATGTTFWFIFHESSKGELNIYTLIYIDSNLDPNSFSSLFQVYSWFPNCFIWKMSEWSPWEGSSDWLHEPKARQTKMTILALLCFSAAWVV